MSTTKLFASIPALRSSIQKDIETYELPIEKNDVNKAFFEPNNDTFEAVCIQEGNPQKYLFRLPICILSCLGGRQRILANAFLPYIGRKINKRLPISSLKDCERLNLQN